MDIKPIRDDEAYAAALAEIECLFDAQPGTPEGDRLEVLAILVEAYEDEHYDVALPEPIEAIQYQSRGLSRRDLEPYIGTRARVSEILNRRRPLTLRMIQRLQAGLGIPAEILIQPYELVDGKSEPERNGPTFKYRQRRRPPRLSSHSAIAED
jgi:HTH-type transcriptional regulator/antitoxin HigA